MGVDPYTGGAKTTESPEKTPGKNLVTKGAGQDARSTRKSCDSCHFQKKKCDGDGTSRCKRCMLKGDGHKCVYSKRSRKKPRCQRPVDKAQTTEGAIVQSGARALNRWSVSVSPATGLIGMRENAFLSDFFTCAGFLPFTSHSDVMESMMKIMTSPSTLHSLGVGSYDMDEDEQYDAYPQAMRGGGGRLPMDPSACIFWCAVALGGLVKGQPIETMARYVQLARGAVDGVSGPVSTEVARAWTILGYVYGFCGDLGGFQGYLQRADLFLHEAIEIGANDTLPVGFAEIVQHRETVKRFAGDVGSDEVETLRKKLLNLPQISDTATEGELYRFFMQTYRMFEQVFFVDVFEGTNSISAVGRPRVQGAPGRAAIVPEDLSGEHPLGYDIAPIEEWAPASSSVAEKMMMKLKVCLHEFERLEHAVDRPHIHAGIGGLLINGVLVFAKAAKKDWQGTLERLSYCVEVIERYPGLCRWLHTSHVIIKVLASMDEPKSRELYNKLRAVYNPLRHPSFPIVPPLEEWHDGSVSCDNFYCRSVERLITSEEIAFSLSSHNACHNACHNAGNKEMDDFCPAGDGAPAETPRICPISKEAGDHHKSFGTSIEIQEGGGTAVVGGGKRGTDATWKMGCATTVVVEPDEPVKEPEKPAIRPPSPSLSESSLGFAIGADIMAAEAFLLEATDAFATGDWLESTYSLLEKVQSPGPGNWVGSEWCAESTKLQPFGSATVPTAASMIHTGQGTS